MFNAESINIVLSKLGQSYLDTQDREGEIWRPLSEWKGHVLQEGYKISNKGRLKNSQNKIVPGHIDPYGYHEVHLRCKYFKDGMRAFVHSLVLTAFVGPPSEDMKVPTVQHIDHTPLNNDVNNLEWMELSENCRDAQVIKIKIIDQDGTHVFGSLEEASMEYCGKATGYINDCMTLGLPIKNKKCQVVDTYYLPRRSKEWVKYVPSKKLTKAWNWKCKIVDEHGEHEFNSITAADHYIGRYAGYIRYHHDHGLPVIYKDSGKVVELYCDALDQL